ncbi:hypothetical protein PR202_gb28708 [Eleusine coracana subsp. coracana]|uniref:FAR1 domain-containing protein n=1 Tax=Eleusine coracana subsp. coracana TaxID=191504 RepID=A0AAV5FY87_ELECO|nr:hypothetical protein PR202_gb28708 [Eleusine coracana subsp. coracana]
MMEPQVTELEDDSINFWASLGVSPHVDQMPLHGVQVVEHQSQPPLLAAAQSQSICKDLFPVESESCLEPQLGMEFDSGEAAKTFYIAYAGRVGFSVRIARSRRSKCSESIIMLRFVCSREGFSKEKRAVAGKKTRKRAASIREGCNAMLEVLRRNDNKWVVTKLVKDHNHEVGLPSRVHYIAIETDTVIDPYIGMEFESLESAKTFYYSYASRVGFEARVRQSRKSQDESLKMLKLVCSRHRYHSGRESNGDDTKRVHALDPSRNGCDALFEIVRKDKDVWMVSKLILEHTHELNPAPDSRVRCVRSQGESLYGIRRQWAPAYTKKSFNPRNLLPIACGNIEKTCSPDFYYGRSTFPSKGLYLETLDKACKSIATLDNYIDLRGYREDASTARFNDLCCDAVKCAKEGSKSSEVYKIAKEVLNKALDEVVLSSENFREQQNQQSCTTSLKKTTKKFGKAKGSSGKCLKRAATKSPLMESDDIR